MNTLKKADKTKIVIFGIFSCVIIYYLKDLSIALGQINRFQSPCLLMPIIIIGLLSFVGILQLMKSKIIIFFVFYLITNSLNAENININAKKYYN